MRIRDKQKQKEYSAKHYKANKEKVMKAASINNKISRNRNKEYVYNYLLEHPCIDCGESNPIVLEFDHIGNNKKDNISTMKYAAYSLDTIIEEISKCEVRCANCHRIITHNRKISSSYWI